MSDITSILARLDKVKSLPANSKGLRWSALCPAHNDKSPSLNITLTPEGYVLVHCWAGCCFEDIARTLDISASEFFPRSTQKRLDYGVHRKHQLNRLLNSLSLYIGISQAAINRGESLSQTEHKLYQQALPRLKAIREVIRRG